MRAAARRTADEAAASSNGSLNGNASSSALPPSSTKSNLKDSSASNARAGSRGVSKPRSRSEDRKKSTPLKYSPKGQYQLTAFDRESGNVQVCVRADQKISGAIFLPPRLKKSTKDEEEVNCTVFATLAVKDKSDMKSHTIDGGEYVFLIYKNTELEKARMQVSARLAPADAMWSETLVDALHKYYVQKLAKGVHSITGNQSQIHPRRNPKIPLTRWRLLECKNCGKHRLLGVTERNYLACFRRGETFEVGGQQLASLQPPVPTIEHLNSCEEELIGISKLYDSDSQLINCLT